MTLPDAGFLEGLQARAQRHGALLIFDEIITWLRLGLGGAQARVGVAPDLTTVGKILGGGFPLAAFGGRGTRARKIYEITASGEMLFALKASTRLVASSSQGVVMTRDRSLGACRGPRRRARSGRAPERRPKACQTWASASTMSITSRVPTRHPKRWAAASAFSPPRLS